LRLALAPAADLAAASLNDLVAATKWLVATERDPDERLYAATPYLRLAAIALAASLLMKGAVAAARMAAANAPSSLDHRVRIALTAVFADELAVETPGLLRKISAPASTRALRAAALDLDG
jgi:hypothetical protein